MFAIDPHEMNPVLEALHRLCLDRKVTLATAESCTGGLLSGLVTRQSGSSQYFLGGVSSYSNDSKTKLISVPRSLIAEHGAVSAPVAKAMAEGIREALGADFSVSITGVAGPGGGSPEKPVGTVFLAFAQDGSTDVEALALTGDRNAVRKESCLFALSGLIQRITSHQGASA